MLERFCKSIGRLVADLPVDEVPARVAELLPEILENRDILRPEHKVLPPYGYGRHDVFLCPNDKFSVLAAVWPAGIVSPIHDHMTWCAFGVFEGVIREIRYRADSADAGCDRAVETGRSDWLPGDAGHLPVGGGDIHCMHNPTDKTAISIHVYGGNAAKLGPNVDTVYREVTAAPA